MNRMITIKHDSDAWVRRYRDKLMSSDDPALVEIGRDASDETILHCLASALVATIEDMHFKADLNIYGEKPRERMEKAFPILGMDKILQPTHYGEGE